MNLTREQFAAVLAPALTYYNRELDEATWQFYYEELCGYTIAQLTETVRFHMRTLKSFPQVSHLAPQRAKKLLEGKSRNRNPQNHPEFTRTMLACDRGFLARVGGLPQDLRDQTFPVDIYPVIRQAVRYYNEYALEHYGAKTAQSQCFSGMSLRLIKEFGPLMEQMNADTD